MQRALQLEDWEAVGDLRVRVGLHTGAAEARDGDYYGSSVNRAARLMAIAHGGQSVCSQATADLVRDDLGEDVTLLDLGDHRLRDLESAEHVYQVTHADLRAEFPPLLSLDALPGNLPLQVSAFVGRDEELKTIIDLLASERLVTLSGPGGVGKSSLAKQALRQVHASFTDGAHWIALDDLHDTTQVVARLAVELRLPSGGPQPPLAQRSAFLGVDTRVVAAGRTATVPVEAGEGIGGGGSGHFDINDAGPVVRRCAILVFQQQGHKIPG
jgi:hypothetical protein